MAAPNQNRGGCFQWGMVPSSESQSLGSLALSAAAGATQLAFSFNIDQAETLNVVKVYQVTKTGSPTTSSYTCAIYSDTGTAPGAPNSSLSSVNAASIPASGNWVAFSGFSQSLSANTQYWIVLTNTDASPTTNYPTWQWYSGFLQPEQTGNYGGTLLNCGWNKVHSTNSGSTWATAPFNTVVGFSLEFSDSTYDGLPIFSKTLPASTSTTICSFGVQEAGVTFNVPANMSANVNAAWMIVEAVSTPGALSFKLWNTVGGNPNLLGQTASVSNVSTSANDGCLLRFTSDVVINSANNPHYLTMNDATSGDPSTKRYSSLLFQQDTISSLYPMDDSLELAVTTNNAGNPVVFSTTAGSWFPFSLLLDTNGEFNSGPLSHGLLVTGQGLNRSATF